MPIQVPGLSFGEVGRGSLDAFIRWHSSALENVTEPWNYSGPMDLSMRTVGRYADRASELADCHDAMLGRIRMLVRMELLGLSRSQNRKAR